MSFIRVCKRSDVSFFLNLAKNNLDFVLLAGFFIPFNFLPDFAKDLNIGSSEAAFLISIIGISNTVTRILVGFVTDQPWADALLINYISLIIGGVTTFLVPFYTGYAMLAAYGVVFGACIGTVFPYNVSKFDIVFLD